MSVVVNARFLTQPITGVQRYAVELSKELKRLRPDLRFVTPRNVMHRELAEQLGAEMKGRLTGHAWEQLELPLYTRGAFLVNLCNTAPVVKPYQPVTLHDAAVFAVPEAYSVAFRSWYKVLFWVLSRTAREVLTVSSFSQRELSHYCRVPTKHIMVIPEGAEHVHAVPADPAILERYSLTHKPFLLAVGSQSPHKNFRGVVEALEQLGQTPFEVVIAGGASGQVHAHVEALPASVKHVGYVSDAELRALYEHATGFVHPAYYEGFGLPPLEAMMCGCPVVTSEAASLPEVCGAAALYFDPHNPIDIAAKIQQLMQDEQLRRSLSQQGRERVRSFTWRKCAEAVLKRIELAN